MVDDRRARDEGDQRDRRRGGGRCAGDRRWGRRAVPRPRPLRRVRVPRARRARRRGALVAPFRGAARRGGVTCRCRRRPDRRRRGRDRGAGRRRRAARRHCASTATSRSTGRRSWSSCSRSRAWRPAACRRLPGEWFAAVVPDAEVRCLDEQRRPTDLELDGRQLVVIARDAHRHAWQRDAIDALTARAPDAVVVEVGLPHWRPPGAATYVATYGAARVNVEAAAERYTRARDAGWSSQVARRAHNPEVAGSNPAPATGKAPETGLFCSPDL